MKAIIVDDEPMTRSGLKRFVDWRKLGIEVAGEAEDGIEAYELFLSLQPNIVLCDVRMPRMDGIEFAARIRQIDPDCKIIFLSGYNDIDYLKSAIKLQAVDYMLKPIQMSELTQLLTDTVLAITAMRKEQQELHYMRKQFDRSKSELVESLLKKILQSGLVTSSENETVAEDIARMDSSFPVNGFYQCFAFEFQNEEAKHSWQEEVMKEAAAVELPLLTAVIDGIGVGIAALSSQRNDDRLGLWLNRLTRRRGLDDSTCITIGAGESCAHLSGCAASYNQALKALSYRFYRGWNTIIWHNSLPSDMTQPLLFDKQAIIKFEDLLRNSQLTEAGQWLDTTINELLLHTPAQIESIRKRLFRWYVAMTRIYSETMWEFENDQLWASMFVSGELYMIRKFMVQRLAFVQQALEETGLSDKRVIRDIIQFIHDHYNNDLSVSMVASHVHLAPTYMCILFKKEQGVSINDYITQYRIKQAKLLLRDRRLKLYEVSSRIGYQDANYFAKVFRKVTGLNPSQYRDTLQVEG